MLIVTPRVAPSHGSVDANNVRDAKNKTKQKKTQKNKHTKKAKNLSATYGDGERKTLISLPLALLERNLQWQMARTG